MKGDSTGGTRQADLHSSSADSARESGSSDTLDSLVGLVEQAIVDLSVHPAGCDDWRFYEQLCLEVADRLDVAVKAYKANAGHDTRH